MEGEMEGLFLVRQRGQLGVKKKAKPRVQHM